MLTHTDFQLNAASALFMFMRWMSDMTVHLFMFMRWMSDMTVQPVTACVSVKCC